MQIEANLNKRVFIQFDQFIETIPKQSENIRWTGFVNIPKRNTLKLWLNRINQLDKLLQVRTIIISQFIYRFD